MSKEMTEEERLLALESDIKNVPRVGELEDLIRDFILKDETIEEIADKVRAKLSAKPKR